METQYTVRHFIDTIASANLLLKQNINKLESDILSFDKFMTEHNLVKAEKGLPDMHAQRLV